MKKIISLLTVLSSVFFSVSAVAQNKPLACQEEAAVGFTWENGRWVTTKFNLGKFILVQNKDGLTTDSVARVFTNTVPVPVTCKTVLEFTVPKISCTNALGHHLYFDPKNLAGGRSYLYGATGAEANADTPYVSVFSCTPF